MLDVLTHGHRGELGHHRVGRRAPDVGQRQRRLVRGDGQVLDRGRCLEDLYVLRARCSGRGSENTNQREASGRTQQGGPGETGPQASLMLLMEYMVGSDIIGTRRMTQLD